MEKKRVSGCPERWWCPSPQAPKDRGWALSAGGAVVSCALQGVGPDGLQASLPTQTIPWFYDNCPCVLQHNYETILPEICAVTWFLCHCFSCSQCLVWAGRCVCERHIARGCCTEEGHRLSDKPLGLRNVDAKHYCSVLIMYCEKWWEFRAESTLKELLSFGECHFT